MNSDNLHEHNGFLLKILSQNIIKKQSTFVESIGLTVSQSRIIYYLFPRSGDEVSQVDIERYLQIKGATVTGTLILMEQNGFITRQCGNSDKRVKSIKLTKKGISTYDVIAASIAAIEAQITRDMSGSEKAEFHSLIFKALKNMEE